MSDLRNVVTRSDLKNMKKSRQKNIKKSNRSNDILIGNSKDCVDGEVIIQQSEGCCRPEDKDDEIEYEWNQVDLPCLSATSFGHLTLTLIEQLVGYHGDVRLKSSRCLDHRVMSFALQQIQSVSCSEEQRRLFRLILRCMVSIVQHHRPLQAEEVIQQLIELASTGQAEFAGIILITLSLITS